MWAVLGRKTIYLDIANTAKEMILLNSEGGDRFERLMERSEIMYLLNGDTEEHSFIITVPDELGSDDIQFMADVILDVAVKSKVPFISVEGYEQRFKVVISNQKEPELIGLNKTPGMSAAEVFKPILKAWDSPGRMFEG